MICYTTFDDFQDSENNLLFLNNVLSVYITYTKNSHFFREKYQHLATVTQNNLEILKLSQENSGFKFCK